MTLITSNTLTINLVVTLFALTCFCSCAEDNKKSFSTENYYLNHLAFAHKGVVYKYVSLSDDGMPDEFWHFRLARHSWENYLYSTMYTPSGEVVQVSKERLSREKAEILSLELIYRDEMGQQKINATIDENSTFIFGPIDSLTKTVYKIEYWDTSVDSVRVSLTKERSMTGPTEYIFEGETIPAILIQTFETLETETEGFTETKWSGSEIFAQGIGLVYYKKTISEQFELEYSLTEIIPYETFQTKRTHQLNPIDDE